MAAIGKIRSWGPWLVGIIGLALFGFIATDFTRQCETSSNQARQLVGKVMGEKLSIQDLQQRSEEYKNFFKAMGYDANEEVLREYGWDDFVTFTILGEEAEKLGLGVTDEEVKAVLAQPQLPGIPRQFLMPDFFNEAGEFDYNNVSQIYSFLQQQAPEQFNDFKNYWEMIEKMLRQELLGRKYLSLLQACMLSNEPSAKLAFDGRNNEAEVVIAALPYSSINDNEVQVTDADLKAKYDELKEMFKTNKETRNIKYVVCNIVPSEADINNLTQSLEEATQQFEEGKMSISDIVSMHRSTLSYTENMPYNAKGLRSISASLLDTLNTMKDSTTTAPFRYSTVEAGKPIEHMAIARLNRRYQDVDSIGYKYMTVLGTDLADAEKRADSVIAVINSGVSIDSVANSMSRAIQTAWVSADTYQGKNIIDADTRAILGAVRPAQVNDVKRVTRSRDIMVFQVTERRTSTLYDVAIVSNEIRQSTETEDKTYNDFSQYVSSCSNADDLEKKAPQAGYQVQEQLNLLSTDYVIGGTAALPNTREAVKWAFAKAQEGSISEIFRDAAEGRLMVVTVTKVNPAGYFDIKSAEPTLRAEVLKDKKAEKLMQQLSGVTTVEQAEQKGAQVDTLHSVGFPMRVPVLHQSERGLSGAIAATAAGQTVKKPFKGDNGVYIFKVLSREANADETFERRTEEANMMRRLLSFITPGQINNPGFLMHDLVMPQQRGYLTNFMEVLAEKAELLDNRYMF